MTISILPESQGFLSRLSVRAVSDFVQTMPPKVRFALGWFFYPESSTTMDRNSMIPDELWDAMNGDERWMAAKAAFTQGDMELAKSTYLRLTEEIAARPVYEFAQIMGRIGIAHCQTHEPEIGIRFFQQGVRVLTAHTLIHSPEFRTPDISLEHLETRIPLLQSQLLYNMGITFRFLGRKNESIEALYQAHELDPTNAEVLLQLGQLYFEMGFRGHTRLCFERLILLQPENPSNWLTLGYLFALDGDHELAVLYFEKAIRLDAGLWEDCSRLLASLNPHSRRAVTVLKQFLEENTPENVLSPPRPGSIPKEHRQPETASIPLPEHEEESPQIFSFEQFSKGKTATKTAQPVRRAA